ncbi:MAG TPA: hypothetical protein VNA21_02330 [Steroidobacteraceae bacterium]|nr:hypothetical protein [Steroidobacteraceae bacterium]
MDSSANHALLARIAGRGTVSHRWTSTSAEQGRLQAWQRALLNSLDLQESAHPSAVTSALGAGLESVTGDWLHAQPVHLAAGLNEVTLVPLQGEFALSSDELAAIAPTLSEHLAQTTLRFHQTRGNQWLIESQDQWKVRTVATEFAINSDWNAALPEGEDAGQIRRLMTEMQMLLHDHPVNQRRSSRGLPTVNSLWFWGNGQTQRAPKAQRLTCVGTHEYLLGACKLHDWQVSAPTTMGDALADVGDRDGAVWVVECADMNELESRWLSPAIAELKRGKLHRIDLIFDTWEISIDRWQLRRFWRRDRSPSEWARA